MQSEIDLIPGCHKPGPDDENCTVVDCEIRGRCRQAEGEPWVHPGRHRTPVEISSFGLGSSMTRPPD